MELATLPLFPLNVVLFPGMQLPLHVFEERYRLMVGTCMVMDRTFGVVLVRSGVEVGGPAEPFEVGTTARIVGLERLPDGRMNLSVVGVQRFTIRELLHDQPYLRGRVEPLADLERPVRDGLAQEVLALFKRYLEQSGIHAERIERLPLPDEPLALSYVVAAALKAPARVRQELLEADSAASRLRLVHELLRWEAGGPTRTSAGPFSLN